MPEITYHLHRESRVATVSMNTAGPVNTIGQQFLADLETTVARAQADKVGGLIFVSEKPRSFLDGANLKEILTGAVPQEVRSVAERYQKALASLAKSPFPVVAILDGQSALGGGFELLLWACDHVFATDSTRVGLPEVGVGLFPAGGGTQTLRRVVGLRTAVDMIMNARVTTVGNLKASSFFTVCPSADLKPRALEWVSNNPQVINRNYDTSHQEPDPVPDDEKRAIVNQARFRFTISPYRPYLLAAIDAIESGLTLPFEQAVQKELDLFVPLVFDPFTRNKIDLFFLVTSTGPKLVKVDPSRAIKVGRMAVIGAGLMGRGIAQVAAERGIKTTMVDVDEHAVKASVRELESSLEELVSRGRWPRERKDALMSNIDWTVDYTKLSGVPLVIECVFEDLHLKRRILEKVQDVNPGVIFASNTSTLPMAEISREARRPENVVGMHYFSPVPLMPLLEVIQGATSSPEAVATAVTMGRAMGKTVILVNDGPGFYTSRTFGNYVMNGFRLAELGISPWEVDMIALRAGFPQGPLHIYGTTGGNVIYHAGRFLAESFPGRVRLSESLVRMHEAGYVGAGSPCFYTDPRRMTPDQSALNYIVPAVGLPKPADDEAEDILLLGMVNEAFWCMSDGVLRDYYSMDLGAVLGIGFPDCWHGPARYVSRKGVKAVRDRLTYLADKFDLPALRPAPEFRRLIACGLDSSLI